jgi:hypothetical protein
MRILLAALLAASLAACNKENGVAPPPLGVQLNFHTYTEDSGLPSNDVFDVLVDSQGRTWFATDMGVGMLENNNMTVFNQSDGLVHPNTRAVVEYGGKIWVATWGGGIAIYNGTSWSTLGVRNGLVSGSVFSIAKDDTSLWFATVGGASQYIVSKSKFITYGRRTGRARWTPTLKGILADVATSSVLPLNTIRGAEVWFGALYGEITVWRPLFERYIVYNTSDSGIPDLGINCIFYNQLDSLFWVGFTNAGIASVDVERSKWTHYDDTDGLPSTLVYSITMDQNGTIWAGTQGGLAKKEGDKFIGYTVANALPAQRVRKVYIDPQNRLWLCFVEGGAAYLVE